jgi:MFS-type transporter involved in bile tolerance (Atg22 family)
MGFEIWYAAIGIAILLNTVVSIFLGRRDDLETLQKSTQKFFVWLVPFFGAIGLWLLNRSQDTPVRAHKSFGGGPQDSSGGGSSGD